ncbi:hypothetical protein R9C00_28645 [Flammeovirgaceae bacterium SG7u.111]|nr:hypothetical protein [Flammeovirgaceae bacterium SG7u.132]WPO35671.1 hypothetical protein R9C00_28645 [Flammeovirgaceae bacterium SG7u.111]
MKRSPFLRKLSLLLVLVLLLGCRENLLLPESERYYVHLSPGTTTLCTGEWVIFRFDTNIPNLRRADFDYTLKTEGEGDEGYLSDDGFYVAPVSILGTSKKVEIRVVLKANPTINAFATVTVFANENKTFVRDFNYFGGEENEKMQVLPTKNGTFMLTGSNYNSVRTLRVMNVDIVGLITWEKDYGLGSAYEIIQATDGGFLVSGFKHGINDADYRPVLMKIDAGGNLIWEKFIAEGEGRSLVSYSDGNLILSTTGGEESSNMNLNGVDRRGNVLWNKSLGAGKVDVMLLDENNQLIIVGSDFENNPSQIILKVLDENLDLVSEQKFDGTTRPVLKKLTLGGYVLGTSVGTKGSSAIKLYELGLAGELKKEITVSTNGDEELFDVIVSTDEGYVVAGRSTSKEIGNAVIVKLSVEGSVEWVKPFGNENTSGIAFSLAEVRDGGYMVMGNLGRDNVIIKTDGEGGINPCEEFGQ